MSKKSKQSSTFERLFDQGKNEFPGDINKTVSPGNNNLNNNNIILSKQLKYPKVNQLFSKIFTSFIKKVKLLKIVKTIIRNKRNQKLKYKILFNCKNNFKIKIFIINGEILFDLRLVKKEKTFFNLNYNCDESLLIDEYNQMVEKDHLSFKQKIDNFYGNNNMQDRNSWSIIFDYYENRLLEDRPFLQIINSYVDNSLQENTNMDEKIIQIHFANS